MYLGRPPNPDPIQNYISCPTFIKKFTNFKLNTQDLIKTMYYDNFYQDEGEREEERVEDKRRVGFEYDDEDDEDTRERIIKS